MSSTKKRKHHIVISDDEDEDNNNNDVDTIGRSTTIDDDDNDRHDDERGKASKAKNSKQREKQHLHKRNKKRVIMLDDDDDDDDDDRGKSKISRNSTTRRRKKASSSDGDEDEDENTISINDIKKKAKSNAKKYAKGQESSDDSSQAKQASQNATKTPPQAKQSNTLFNYFKPLQAKKCDEKAAATPLSPFTQIKDAKDSGKKASSPKKLVVSDEFMTTTLVKGQEPKVVAFDDKSSKSHKTIDDNDDAADKLVKPKSISAISSSTSSKSSPKKEKKATAKIDSKINAEASVEKKAKTLPPIEKKKKLKEEEEEETFLKSENEKPQPAQIIVDRHVSPKKLASSISKSLQSKQSKSPRKQQQKVEEEDKASLPRIVEPKRVSDLWVDKYKPTSLKQVIGQQGDRSALNKLLKWLRDWHRNLGQKPGFGKWASDDGVGFRAALLSGPPGIGKTTTAQIVCRELGYDFLELNASDARNKKSLQEDVRDLLSNTKLTSFFKARNHVDDAEGSSSKQALTAKHCVIMDEVDGMAGNEDRGGVQELIQLIKNAKVPIICICNDRSNPKMRSLVNHCFDLRFAKPRVDQIKGPLMSIAFREQISIAPNVLNDLIVSSNFDIRQCIHNLSLLGTGHRKVSNMINTNSGYDKPIKDVKLGPFEAVKKVFSTGIEYAQMSFADKSDLFFADYSIMPLFVYENYHTINLASKESSIAKQLKRTLKSIDSMSAGDLIEKELRTNQNWSLLPLQAALSTVTPGAYMRSANGLGFPQFPQFMGKLSTTNKCNRLADELVAHMTLSIGGSARTSFALDYLQPLKNALVAPLIESDKAGISATLDTMQAYSITKENMDSVLELAAWTGDADPMKRVDAKTKAALTRAYNRKDFALPYATDRDARVVTTKRGKAKSISAPKGKGKAGGKMASLVEFEANQDKSVPEEEEEEEEEAEDEKMMDFF